MGVKGGELSPTGVSLVVFKEGRANILGSLEIFDPKIFISGGEKIPGG